MDHDNSRGNRRQADEENMADEKEKREKNRKAAQKCRQNKQKQLEELKLKNQELEVENQQLSDEKNELIKQTKKYKGLVDMHCEKGCKIPEEMIQLWSMWSTELMGASSSDENASEADMPQAAEVTEEIHAPSNHLSSTQESSPDPQNTTLGDDGNQVEAPTALFSGQPLDAHKVTRRRSNSSSHSLPAPRVSSDQLPLTNASLLRLNDSSRFLAPASVPNPPASTSAHSPKDVEMQTRMTTTPARARNITANVMSNTFLKAENVPNIVTISQNLTQLQNQQAFPAIQPRLENGTRGHLFENPSKPEENPAEQLTMEYQNEAEVEVRSLSNEDTSNHNFIPSSYDVESIENYTYLEDMMRDVSSNEHTESGNDAIQGASVASNNVGSLFQGQTQSQHTVPFHTMAPALLSIATEMSPSLRQQFKTSLNSSPSQATPTMVGTGVISTCQHVMTKPQAEVHITSNTRQFRLDTQGVQPVIASRQVGPRSETMSSRDLHAAIDRSLSMPQEMSTYKATVLSPDQLFMIQGRKIMGKNPQGGYFIGRKQSLQEDAQHEQQVTWPSTTNGATSMAGNSKSRINHSDIFSFSRPGLNIPHSAMQSVPQKTNPKTTRPAVPTTVTSQNYSSTTSQLLHNTPSDQIKQHSFIHITNGVSSHGHNRRDVTATNDVYINTANDNPPSQQLATQITIANITNSGFSPNVATANNAAYSSPTRVNTMSPQFRPQANCTISKNRHNLHATNADYISTPVARNISTEPGDQYLSKVPMTSASSGHQAVSNKRVPLKAPSFSRMLQVPNALNLYSPNTEAFCNGTDIADQALTTMSSEALFQSTNTFSRIRFLSQERPSVNSVNNMSILNTPTGTYDNITSQPEDIDYLSESPQACTTAQLVDTSENTAIGNSCLNTEVPSFNIPSSFSINSISSSQIVSSADLPNTVDQYPSKVPMTSASSGHQAIINPRLPLKAPSFPRELQVLDAVNLYSLNTEASCNGTDIADQALTIMSSEELLQPTNTFSRIRFLSQERSSVNSVNNMSILNTPTGTYDNVTSQPEDIDYLSESPQACTTAQLVDTSENTAFGDSCSNIESLSFSITECI